MKDELRGKVIAVTGASSGIGLATAETLAHHGAAVVGFARRFSRPRISQSPEAESIMEVALDVTCEQAVADRFEELGHLDGLILSHGSVAFGAAARLPSETFRSMLESHVIGSANVVREALKLLRPSLSGRRTGGIASGTDSARDSAKGESAGNIIFIGSIATRKVFADASAYTAVKMAQLGYARVLTEELRAAGVRVTTIIAGAVNTPLWDERPGFDRERMMKPTDIAGLVVSILRRPQLALDEIVVTPPDGAL